MVEATVERVMPYGIFLKLESGASGLIPNSEMGTPKGSNHSRMFPVGTKMQVIVIGSDKQTRKVSLSRNAVSEKVERDEFKQYRTQQKGDDQASSALGSFGELLQKHLERGRNAVGSARRGHSIHRTILSSASLGDVKRLMGCSQSG